MARLVISCSGLLQAAAALAGGLTLAAFFGGLWWGLEITTHFRLQYGVSWWLARRRRNYPSVRLLRFDGHRIGVKDAAQEIL